MNNRKHYKLLLLLLCISLHSWAQSPHGAIKVLANVGADAIWLRWAPDQSPAWRKANRYGYMIERYTIVRDGVLLSTPERKLLNAQPILPRPLTEWKELVQRSDYAAVIAQAIYGEHFEVNNAQRKNDVASVVALSEEQEQRFSLALYAADLDFEAARQAALGFIDHDISRRERYLYRVYVAPHGNETIDTGSVYVNAETISVLPQPQGLVAIPGDKSVLLSWDYRILRGFYNSYIVERSEDGRQFLALGGLPLTNLNDKEEHKAVNMYYTDTLPANARRYYYRVRGVNAFGIQGPASDTIGATGIEQLSYVPFIATDQLLSDQQLQLGWEFDPRGEPLIKEFTINISDKADGVYHTVLRSIRPDQRSVIYTALKPMDGAAYVTITAVALQGQSRTSFPVLVQTIDSIPPAPPSGLKGSIDSLGLVHISWRPNTEKDILGYRVYRAAQDGEEFSGISAEIDARAHYTDTVQVVSLNSNVLYRVVAVDKRFNNSAYSEILRLRKPDLLPPSPAIITGYELATDAVYISWEPGNSPDVAHYALFRCEAGDTTRYWEVDRCTPAAIRNPMKDIQAVAGKSYSYFILTTDSSRLDSRSPQMITLKASRDRALLHPGVKGLDVYKDQPGKYLDLYWQYDQPGVREFQVYRAANDAPLSLWKTIGPHTFRVRDMDVRPGKQYTYAVRAQFSDGTQSKMTDLRIGY